MKNKKTIIGLIIVLALSISVLALPKNDAKYIFLNKYYKINKDGSWSLKYSSKVSLNSYLATRRLFGETFITYNKEYQNLKILKSITTMANGKIIPTPENGYNEILPYSAHGFADFTNIRQMVVSHTGLERGATEELDYILKSNKDFLKGFSVAEPLYGRVPIDELTIVFETPTNINLNYKVLNSDIIPMIKNNGKTIKYIFKIKNVNKVKYFYPYYPADYPYLFVSTGNNFEYLKTNVNKQVLPEKLVEKLNSLKYKSLDNFDFLLKIQKYISEHIQTANLGVYTTGLNIRSIKKIIDTHYATPLEKASLLYTVLKHYKLNPEILVLTPVINFNSLTSLDKLLIKLVNNGKTYYIDPINIQSEFYPYGSTHLYFYNINKKIYEKIEPKKYTKNNIKISGKIYLCPKKMSELSLITKGYFNDYRKLLKNELSFINSILSKTLEIRATKIKNINLKKVDEFSANILAKGYIFKKNYTGYYFLKNFSIPGISDLRTSVFYTNLPYHFKSGFQINYDFDIIIPKNISVSYMKDNIKIQNKVGVYSRKITKQGDNKLHLTIVFKIYKSKIKDKLLLKELFDTLKKDRDTLILTYEK